MGWFNGLRGMTEAFFSAAGRPEENEEPIAYTVVRGTARRRRIAIRIGRDGSVTVLLPPRALLRDAETAVRLRADWIRLHRQQALVAPQSCPLRYVEGEEHWYRGELYRLALAENDTETRKKTFFVEPIFIENTRYLQMRLNCIAPPSVHRHLFLWYKQKMEQLVGERLTVLCFDIPRLAATPPFRIRTMRRRWGSCSVHGGLTLNTQLIKVPPFCLDYVLFHELAHLKEHNHSKRFYAVLDALLPDWRRGRDELARWAPLVLA